MNCARSCENLLNFVKVMPRILLVPFFPDTVYFLQCCQYPTSERVVCPQLSACVLLLSRIELHGGLLLHVQRACSVCVSVGHDREPCKNGRID